MHGESHIKKKYHKCLHLKYSRSLSYITNKIPELMFHFCSQTKGSPSCCLTLCNVVYVTAGRDVRKLLPIIVFPFSFKTS